MKAISFVQERSTKNKVRFAEVVEEGKAEAIGHIYVSKWALKALGNPAVLTVTIEPVDTTEGVEQWLSSSRHESS